MSGASGRPHPEDFGLFMQETYRSVLAIGLLFRLRDALCRYLRVQLRPDTMTVPLMMLISTIALLLNAILYPFGLGCGGAAVPVLADFAILIFVLFLFPLVTWSELAAISQDINELLDSSANRHELISWWTARLKFMPQLAFSLCGAIGALTATALMHPLAEKHVEFCASSYISTTAVGGLGLNACYWLWMVPFLIRRISRFPSLNVRWHHPADTPALQALSRLLIRSAWRTAIGMVFTITPVLYFYRIVVKHGTFIVLFNVVIAIISLTTLAIVAAAPQRWLTRIVVEYSEQALDSIDAYIARLSHKGSLDDRTVKRIEPALAIYDSVSSGKSSLIRPDILTQYIAVGLTITVPFIIQLALHFLR